MCGCNTLKMLPGEAAGLWSSPIQTVVAEGNYSTICHRVHDSPWVDMEAGFLDRCYRTSYERGLCTSQQISVNGPSASLSSAPRISHEICLWHLPLPWFLSVLPPSDTKSANTSATFHFNTLIPLKPAADDTSVFSSHHGR